jgi:hypothetical protein
MWEPERGKLTAGQHELCTVAHRIDGTILHHQTLVPKEQRLQGHDNLAKVRLVPCIVICPLGIQNVVQCHEAFGLVDSTRPHSTQLLHVGTNAKKKPGVDAQGSDVRSRLARDAEDAEATVIVEFEELNVVDGSDTELALDCRNERRSLEESTRERLEDSCQLNFASGDLVVEADDTNVLLAGSLLRLHETASGQHT